MNYLAFDCSTAACSVALQCNNDVIQYHKIVPRQHAELILPTVCDLLATASIDLSMIDAIFYGQGPGSFIGIRTAVSVAQGLAFGADIPLVALSSLRIIAEVAYQYHDRQNVLVASDARLAEVYYAAYQLDSTGMMQLMQQECVVPPSQLILPMDGLWSLAGNGWSAYQDHIDLTGVSVLEQDEIVLYPEARAMFLPGEVLFKKGLIQSPKNAEPSYIRKNVARKVNK